jgi:RNA polymerase sigma-70 factor (ECF subfamily)
MSLTAADDDLLRRVRRGDEAAFSALYRRWQAGIYRYALRMSGSPSVAEDVTQDVFMALMEDGGRYDPGRGPLSSYMYGIARNKVLRRLERERGYVPLVVAADDGADDPAWTAGEDPLADLARRERVDLVWQAVLALPPHYREVVVLCDLQELTYEEVAAVLGCALGTVRSRLHRARDLLATRLRSEAHLPAGRRVGALIR